MTHVKALQAGQSSLLHRCFISYKYPRLDDFGLCDSLLQNQENRYNHIDTGWDTATGHPIIRGPCHNDSDIFILDTTITLHYNE